jgi:hypothetical protein
MYPSVLKDGAKQSPILITRADFTFLDNEKPTLVIVVFLKYVSSATNHANLKRNWWDLERT